MSWKEYFLWSQNWSLEWAIICFIALGVYSIWYRPNFRKFLPVFTSILLIYIVFGSPLNNLLEFGLHSMAMIQHAIIIMLVPLLLWIGFSGSYSPAVDQNNLNKTFVLLAWLSGTASMWIAHFVSAAKISAETGLEICGIYSSNSGFLSQIPNVILLLLVFAAGLFFLMPVFSKNPKFRIKSLTAVIYLFTACVSCSLLGLWVAFSAGAPSGIEAASLLTTLRNPIPMTLNQDQELAGMIMWVPGCIMYVTTSVYIASRWLEGEQESESLSTQNQMK